MNVWLAGWVKNKKPIHLLYLATEVLFSYCLTLFVTCLNFINYLFTHSFTHTHTRSVSPCNTVSVCIYLYLLYEVLSEKLNLKKKKKKNIFGTVTITVIMLLLLLLSCFAIEKQFYWIVILTQRIVGHGTGVSSKAIDVCVKAKG